MPFVEPFNSYDPYSFDEDDTPMVFVDPSAEDPMSNQDKARTLVLEKYNRDIVDLSHQDLITFDEIFIVWYAKTLQNWKALVCTYRADGYYYELTYNGDKAETYVDVYKKLSNETITDASR